MESCKLAAFSLVKNEERRRGFLITNMVGEVVAFLAKILILLRQLAVDGCVAIAIYELATAFLASRRP